MAVTRFATGICTALLMAAAGHPSLSVAAPASAAATPSQALAALADRYIDSTFDLNPLQGTGATGDERYADKFVDNLTPAYRAREAAFLDDMSKALRKIDAGKLSASERITYEILEYQVATRKDAAKLDLYRTPFNQFYSLPLTMVQYASTKGAQPFRTVVQYEQFLRRLEGFPGWVDSAIVNMKDGVAHQVVQPKILMTRVLAQLKTQMVADVDQSGFMAPVKNFPIDFSEADRVRLTAAYRQMAADKIIPAFRKLHDFVEKEYLPACRDTAGLAGTPNGAAKYAYLVRQSTTTNMTAEEVHALGLREVARIRDEMEKVCKQVGFAGDLTAFLAYVRADAKFTPFKTEDEVIEAFRTIQKRVEPTLPKLFAKIPRAKLEIRPEPEITKATAAAHYNIGAADGSRPGVFYAPVRDASKYPTPGMTSLFLHEALPGHHFQGSLAQESDLPRARRYTWLSAYGEGWGLYAESLGNELGVYEDPYQYLGMLLGEMHRAIRLVVDTGMHAKGWSREQAIAYSLQNEGGSEAGQVQEVERYMAIPGQALSYKIGQLKISELRARAEKKLGAKFDIKEFHTQILDEGSMPLAVLEKKIDRWLATKK